MFCLGCSYFCEIQEHLNIINLIAVKGIIIACIFHGKGDLKIILSVLAVKDVTSCASVQ